MFLLTVPDAGFEPARFSAPYLKYGVAAVSPVWQILRASTWYCPKFLRLQGGRIAFYASEALIKSKITFPLRRDITLIHQKIDRILLSHESLGTFQLVRTSSMKANGPFLLHARFQRNIRLRNF